MPADSKFTKLRSELDLRRSRHLYRSTRVADSPQQPQRHIDGKPLLTFCSNDYLGLANHPAVIRAFQQAANTYGVGSGAAHLVNGHSRPHQQLEEALAAFTGRERALLFSTGYMANLGVVNALLTGRNDLVYADRLNHASLVDAALLSGAKLIRYPHNDTTSLGKRLLAHEGDAPTQLILTDGVFSMDGDVAPLAKLALMAQQHEAWLMVDDAHGFGVLGNTGAGLVEAAGLNQDDVPILMGTLGKALGTAGAFIAGSHDLIEYLIQTARTWIYTTAQPPAVAAATLVSLQLVATESWRREHLRSLIQQFRTGAVQLGLPLMPSDTAIQPMLVGSSEQALSISRKLEARGILVTAIRPPTVPVETARLRVTLSAAHTVEDVERLLDALGKA
ncbi:8-amino-7-oxononanoate synthase [Thiothrix subterranea]|uniref:8-amino-7-oxononanoate synthase n=1 Tax=Thiothrix subterranea TaxID=2735563 RepID=A0AA51R5F0_9GAMM|nr:8-amino-7-oxononanoate synthase [Thiothrix subterranea]MDQ5768513.1 8-amino-7-oxononanoate synthase [Thiothrix subterranea]WML87606.1 8-amino-7-oxononanoate synthase [Thiothrix subterranea]